MAEYGPFMPGQKGEKDVSQAFHMDDWSGYIFRWRKIMIGPGFINCMGMAERLLRKKPLHLKRPGIDSFKRQSKTRVL